MTNNKLKEIGMKIVTAIGDLNDINNVINFDFKELAFDVKSFKNS